MAIFIKCKMKLWTILLLFASSALCTEENVPTSLESSSISGNIRIDTSEYIKDTRTTGSNQETSVLSASKPEETLHIGSTSSVDQSSKKRRHLEDNSLSDDSTLDTLPLSRGSANMHNEYDFIQPTSIQAAKNLRIPATVIQSPGEDLGVSIEKSGPLRTSEDKNSEPKTARAFEKRGRADDELLGVNYNQIESLGNLAKITVDGNKDAMDHVPAQTSFRKSRDEENRKANPDIQEIITGIVKILHGKTNGQEGSRPRPPPSRINNRGPPRISDLPPLDFDTPPSFVPPAVQNKIPPPYPFDIPPSPPSKTSLPPQPSKAPGGLPSHPFIDGVPLPELLIPGQSGEYDTISMSEPSLEMVPPMLDPHPSVNKAKNDTRIEPNKNKNPTNKPNGPPNKMGPKRPRPRPPFRRPVNMTTTEKPEVKKTPPMTMKPVADIVSDELTKNSTAQEITPSTVSTQKTPTTSSIRVAESNELPMLLEPVIGIGEATPVLEPSISAFSVSKEEQKPTPSLAPTTTTKFEARPGIVLDDPEYKPGGHKRPTGPHRPIITAPPPPAGGYGEIFDVTVHAVQGGEATPGKPVIVPVNFGGGGGDVSVITRPEEGQDFVSIDGKRTYINLFGETPVNAVQPTASQPPVTQTRPPVASPAPVPTPPTTVNAPPSRRPPYKRPSQPAIRIDTCIVGDESTCDAAQNERCQTEDDVSSCHCRPGYNRRKHRDPCRRVVSMATSIRVDRFYDRPLSWRDNFADPASDDFHELSYEANQAINSAMSMTPFSDDFIAAKVNKIYLGKNSDSNSQAVFVNLTVQLEENLDTIRPAVRHEVQTHLLRAIQRRNNNFGTSALWVDSPPGSILPLQDIDECSSLELHDCHARADCSNTFGSYTCSCRSGTRDPWIGNVHREGRNCETCTPDHCNNRGECMYDGGQKVCQCNGSFYGTQCEIDGEVLGVAIGASVAAAIIIILTFICLLMWSRRWAREQKSAVGMGSPVFGYMANGNNTVKTAHMGAPAYQMTIDERVRWAQMAEAMAHANLYAQPEPGMDRNYGCYPTLPTHSMNSLPLPAIAPPVPLPRLTLAGKGPHSVYGASMHGSVHHSMHGMRASLDTTSSSEEDLDKTDLLGKNFLAPRPKSRASITNQSGIYYDVDLERAEMQRKQNNIPMNTYASNTHQRPFFR